METCHDDQYALQGKMAILSKDWRVLAVRSGILTHGTATFRDRSKERIRITGPHFRVVKYKVGSNGISLPEARGSKSAQKKFPNE